MKCLSAVLCAVGLVSAVVAAQPAWAGEWSPPVCDPAIALPFGAEYPGGVHRGIDIPAEAGSEVVAPSAGRVAFSGTVPADGGGTCNAVTIETDDGLKISLLPLEGVYVQAGAEVCQGDAVGRLAALGDDSSEVAHIHMGVRRGDRYIDPAPLLQLDAVQEPCIPTVVDAAPGEAGDVGRAAGDGGAPVVATAHPAAALSPAAAQSPAVTQSPAIAGGGVSTQSPARVSADLASTCPAPGVSTDPDHVSHTRPVRARLVCDAGVPAASPGVEGVGAAAAPGATRWVSGPSRRLLGPTLRQPAVRTLAALAAAMGGVMPIIARSKALVRVR